MMFPPHPNPLPLGGEGTRILAILLLLLAGCSVQQPPETPELVAEALPETTEVPAEWSAEAEDSGEVDDGWLAGFGDPRLGGAFAMQTPVPMISSPCICEKSGTTYRF